MGIRVKCERLNKEAKLPVYANDSDSGADVFCLEDFTIKPNSTALVPTGLRVYIPHGYEIQVRSKSGLANKQVTVHNSPGTVDETYVGELKVILFNSSSEIKEFTKGDKIAQLVLAPVVHADYIDVELGRGTGGFGSTGK